VLSVLVIGLCQTHLAATQLKVWRYNELTQTILISKQEQRKMFFIIFRRYLSQIY